VVVEGEGEDGAEMKKGGEDEEREEEGRGFLFWYILYGNGWVRSTERNGSGDTVYVIPRKQIPHSCVPVGEVIILVTHTSTAESLERTLNEHVSAI